MLALEKKIRISGKGTYPFRNSFTCRQNAVLLGRVPPWASEPEVPVFVGHAVVRDQPVSEDGRATTVGRHLQGDERA